MVTVLRDGKRVATKPAVGLEPLDMARLMVGRDLLALYPPRPPVPTGEPAFEIGHFGAAGFAEDASFTVRPGEILGFSGLVGAGRTELFEALFGLRKGGGEIRMNGEAQQWRDARAGMRAGAVYLTEDRKSKGLLLEETIATNLTLAALDRFQRGPLVDRAKETRALDEAIQRFDIRIGDRNLLAGQMSGGNQQKLLLAKMMQLNPRVVVIDEPTRGIDIGAKQQIYRFIAALAAEGRSVIVISSEMTELIGICHRIIVMRNGRIVGEVAGEAMNEHAIVVLATGVDAKAEGRSVMTQAAHEAPVAAPRRRVNVAAVAPFAALALICALGGVANPRFLSFDNLTNVLTRSTFIATIAVGQTLVITGGGLDLSVGAMAAFVAGLTIMFLNSGLIDNMPLLIVSAMALSLVVGALCGLFNGLTTTLGKIEPFIVTLGTMGIFRSLRHLARAGRLDHHREPGCAGGLSAGLFRRRVRRALSGAGHPRRGGDRRLYPLRHRLWATRARGRLERGRRALFGHQRRARAHDHLRAAGPLRRACGHRLRASAEFHHFDHRLRLGADGDHRRRRRRHPAQGRRRSHLGDDRRRAHPRSHRQHHAVVESGQRIPHRRGSGRDHHHRDAGATRHVP